MEHPVLCRASDSGLMMADSHHPVQWQESLTLACRLAHCPLIPGVCLRAQLWAGGRALLLILP